MPSRHRGRGGTDLIPQRVHDLEEKVYAPPSNHPNTAAVIVAALHFSA